MCSSELFGQENADVIRTVSVTDTIQSTCHINFTQPTTSLITMITPTPDQSVIPTSVVTKNSATKDYGTVTTDFTTTDSAVTDSTPIAIIAASITGGIIGSCTVFICIVGLIIKNKRKQGRVRRGMFVIQSFSSLLNRYV